MPSATSCTAAVSRLAPTLAGDITNHGAPAEVAMHLALMKEGGNSKIKPTLKDWSDTAMRYIGVVGTHDAEDSSGWVSTWNQYFSGQKDLGEKGTYFTLEKNAALFIVLDSDHPARPRPSGSSPC